MASTSVNEVPQELRAAVKKTHTEMSRHRTSEGLVLWLRCRDCARPRMLLVPDGPGRRPVIAGSGTPDCVSCF